MVSGSESLSRSQMFLYLIRHGQSEGNKGGFHQNWDTPLSDNGIKQAKLLAKRLGNIHFDLIYSSPTLRARQTAEIINEEFHTPIEFWEDLIEMKTPSEIKGKKIDDPEVVKIRTLIRENHHNGDWKYSDEENFNEISERAKNVIGHLEEKHGSDTILCVSHATMMKAIIGKIIFGDKLTPEIFQKMREHMYPENTGVTICEKSEKYGWTLNTWSDTTHLK